MVIVIQVIAVITVVAITAVATIVAIIAAARIVAVRAVVATQEVIRVVQARIALLPIHRGHQPDSQDRERISQGDIMVQCQDIAPREGITVLSMTICTFLLAG